jgi:hypothetical protein
MNSSPPPNTAKIIAEQCDRPVAPAVQRLVEYATQQFAPAVYAVLFYGSCRRNNSTEGLVDLYVLLDSYASLPTKERLLAHLIAPNVYFLQLPDDDIRCKCTVISAADFQRGCHKWFHPYIWGRFTQPITLAYCADDSARQQVLEDLVGAATTFVNRTQPLLAPRFTSADLWCTGLSRSFGCELRAESPQRVRLIYDADRDYYDGIATALLASSALQAQDFANEQTQSRWLSRLAWRQRAISGKLLSVIRVLKSAFTFNNGLDYIKWKLERHSGKNIEIPDRVRKYPAIFLWPFFWRLYREGVFR